LELLIELSCHLGVGVIEARELPRIVFYEGWRQRRHIGLPRLLFIFSREQLARTRGS
jgi:hypothetical protein